MKNKTKLEKLRLLKEKKLTKQQIYSFKKLLNNQRFEKDPEVNKLTDHVKEKLELGVCKEYLITKEQTKQGIDWLKNFCFKKNGTLRKNVNNYFSDFEIDVIRNFSKFRFVGFHVDRSREHFGILTYIPVWRTYSKDGDYFDYYCEDRGTPVVLL